MEKRAKREDSEADGSDFSIVDSIKTIAAHNARAELNTEEQLILFLQSWWSRTYNRPLKDPLLQSYSLEELLYEFYDRIERTKAEQERLELEGDKIEESKEREVLDWAEAEERKELESMKSNAAKAKESKKVDDPTKDEANVKWMDEQIAKAKELYGDDFGEDINESFE